MNTAKKLTGSSLMHSVQTCPSATAVTLGFSQEQADRIVNTRRVLPYVEDRNAPALDARKLWERIGKPEGQFTKWTARGVADLLGEFALKGQVVEVVTPTKGRPRLDYLLSRDCAAHLAMLARTAEGDAIRAAFLDMEELAMKLVTYGPVRGHKLGALGDKLHSLCIGRAHDLKKAADTTKRRTSEDLKSSTFRAVCRALTGHRPSHWEHATGRAFRDALSPQDLDRYVDALVKALAFFALGDSPEDIEAKLSKILSKAERIDPRQYADRARWAAAVAHVDALEADTFSEGPSLLDAPRQDDDEPF